MAHKYVTIAEENIYGTPPASGWQGFPVYSDDHKANVRTLQSEAIVDGEQGPSAAGRRSVVLDAQGKIATDLASAGMVKLYRALFGPPVTTVLSPGKAWQHVYTTKDVASAVTLSTQVGRPFTGGGDDRDTYVGGAVTEGRFSQPPPPDSAGTGADGLARLELDVDYRTMLDPTAHAQHLPTYAVAELLFSVGTFSAQIGADLDDLADECLRQWELKLPTGVDTKDRCASSLLKDQPTRADLPAPTMDAGDWPYKLRDYYDAYLAGDVLALRAAWTAPAAYELDTGIVPSVTFDVAAFGFNDANATPQMARNERTKQQLPMAVLHNGVDPMVTMTVVSSDAVG